MATLTRNLFVSSLLALLLCVPALAEERFIDSLSDGAVLHLPELDPGVPSPAEYLGYRLGERFTHHERIVGYLERLAGSSERVEMWTFGETYEGRPLVLVAISAPDNLARLEEVRERHLRLADPESLSLEEEAELVDSEPVFTWLAYGVHGNESSSAEAAMATAYTLAAAGGEWEAVLEETVVLIDPLQNPDGRERYVHFFETRRGRVPDPAPFSAEHSEPWPGGRQNHYLIDLNRDWAWQSQTETQAKVAAYRRWEPQVYVDLHEMGRESSYFFPPSAQPINPEIRAATEDWLEVFGKGNAAAFDRHGWLYYVGESFDLFYPAYGDSYPTLRGAIGMTYEMAGHGSAGSVVRRIDGSLLRLSDRIARHFTSSLATVKTAVENRRELLAHFAASRRESVAADERTYVWRDDGREAAAAAELLSSHGIEVSRLAGSARVEALGVNAAGEPRRVELPAGSFVVSSAQSLGRLVRTLMDRESAISGEFLREQRRRLERNQFPEFYDVTAWSLPLAYGLESWVVEGPVEAAAGAGGGSAVAIEGEGDYGYLMPPQGITGYRAAAALSGASIRHRLLLDEARVGEHSFPPGTLFVPRRGNPEDLEATLEALAGGGVTLRRVGSGYTESGISLGSNNVVAVRPPSIGLVGGSGVSVTSFGYLWHLLDRGVEAPVHRLDTGSLRAADLAELDVLVLPSGSYRELVNENLERWVRGGGVLVAVGRAVGALQAAEMVEVKNWEAPEPEEQELAVDVPELTPGDRPVYTPGVVLATELRGPHALLAGLESSPPVLYSGSTVLMPSGNPQRDLLVAVKEDPVLSGFTWDEAEERLRGALLVGVERSGRGAVVYFAQEPVFRLFWRATAPIFLNSVLYGPSLADRNRL